LVLGVCVPVCGFHWLSVVVRLVSRRCVFGLFVGVRLRSLLFGWFARLLLFGLFGGVRCRSVLFGLFARTALFGLFGGVRFRPALFGLLGSRLVVVRGTGRDDCNDRREGEKADGGEA